jgi:demethylmenaquinone methyltransferase/2-methoxy-6-polyprenyl-1,4-benzoquinol methylase
MSNKQEVKSMFDKVAGRYDFLNHFLSVGIDYYWRKVTVKRLGKIKPKKILDVATGTGDLAIAARKLNPEQIIGIDISEGMVNVGIEKIKKRGLDKLIFLRVGDSENIDFETNYFDGLTVGFGVRNYETLEKGLAEMLRVIRPGGLVLILEFSQPQGLLIKPLYSFYFKYILPTIGNIISGNSTAYTYLHDSVSIFPFGESFAKIMRKVGYQEVEIRPLSFGIATLYVGTKK